MKSTAVMVYGTSQGAGDERSNMYIARRAHKSYMSVVIKTSATLQRRLRDDRLI